MFRQWDKRTIFIKCRTEARNIKKDPNKTFIKKERK